MSLIDAVNDKIDNAPLWTKQFAAFNNRRLKNQGYQVEKRFVKNPYDIVNLTKHGHRKYGHHALSSMLIGAIEAIKRGMLAAWSHIAADSFSNHLIKTWM
jgi:hypothetical protein